MEREIGRPVGVLSRAATAAVAATVLALCLAAASAFLSSCRKAEHSFQLLLARLDAQPGTYDEKAFAAAASMAESTIDRLRLLKRARRHGASAASAVASLILDGGPVSEPVAFAASCLFLDAGLPLRTLALFSSDLSAADRPALFAQAWIAARRQGLLPPVAMDSLVAAADGLGQPDFLVDGALVAMAGGDVASAAALLTDAVGKGGQPPLRLLWDSGVWDALAERAPRPGDPSELNLSADAALLAGQRARAVGLYLELIGDYPEFSYKPYAALARLSGSERPGSTPLEDYALPFGSAWTRAESAPSGPAGSGFMERMASLFPANEDAVLERAWYRLSAGDPDGADSILKGFAVDSDALSALSLATLSASSPDRAKAAAMLLAAERPGSAAVLEAALACLVSLGSWKEFLTLERSAPKDLPRSWFWEAAALALKGDAKAAADVIRMRGAGFPPRIASFDLGLMELAAGRAGEAALAFVTAAGEKELPSYEGAPGLPEARCWEMAGRAWAQAGDVDLARGAYRTALSLDPGSLAARSGLELLP